MGPNYPPLPTPSHIPLSRISGSLNLVPGQCHLLLSHLHFISKPSVLSPNQIYLCQSDTKTVLPNPDLAIFLPCLISLHSFPSHPALLFLPMFLASGYTEEPGRSPESPSCSQFLALAHVRPQPAVPSSLLYLVSPRQHPQTQAKGTLLWALPRCPHAEGLGLLCSLLSSHEALTTGVCLLACLPHPGRSSGRAQNHSSPALGLAQSRYSVHVHQAVSCLKQALASVSLSLLPSCPQAPGWCPGTSLCLMAIPSRTGAVYLCPLTAHKNDCERVDIRKSEKRA